MSRFAVFILVLLVVYQIGSLNARAIQDESDHLLVERQEPADSGESSSEDSTAESDESNPAEGAAESDESNPAEGAAESGGDKSGVGILKTAAAKLADVASLASALGGTKPAAAPAGKPKAPASNIPKDKKPKDTKVAKDKKPKDSKVAKSKKDDKKKKNKKKH